LSDELIENMPTLKSMMDKYRRIKNKHLKNFNQLLDDIPNFLSLDMKGKKFVQYDHGVHEEKKLVVMFSDDNLKYI
jgi:hypothetical protein